MADATYRGEEIPPDYSGEQPYVGLHARPRVGDEELPPDYWDRPYVGRHARRIEEDDVIRENPVTGEAEVVPDNRSWFRRRWDDLRGVSYTAPPAAMAAWRARREAELDEVEREERRFSNKFYIAALGAMTVVAAIAAHKGVVNPGVAAGTGLGMVAAADPGPPDDGPRGRFDRARDWWAKQRERNRLLEEEDKIRNRNQAIAVGVGGLAAAIMAYAYFKGFQLDIDLCGCDDNRKATENGDKFDNNPNFFDDREGPRSPDAIDRPDVDIEPEDREPPPAIVEPVAVTFTDTIAPGDGITHTIRDFDLADGVKDGNGHIYYAEYERLEAKGLVTDKHFDGVRLYEMADDDMGYAHTGRVVLSAEVVNELSELNRNVAGSPPDC